MILQIAPDARQIDEASNAELIELMLRADARAHQ